MTPEQVEKVNDLYRQIDQSQDKINRLDRQLQHAEQQIKSLTDRLMTEQDLRDVVVSLKGGAVKRKK